MESPNSVGTLVRGLDDKFSFVRNNAYNQLLNLASGDTVGTMVSILQGGGSQLSPIKDNLIDYLRTIPGGDGLTNPFAGASVTRKIPEIQSETNLRHRQYWSIWDEAGTMVKKWWKKSHSWRFCRE